MAVSVFLHVKACSFFVRLCAVQDETTVATMSSFSSPKSLAANLLLPTYKQMLHALSKWLDKAANDDLLSHRLARDMLPLSAQVCFVCLQAQEAFYRLQGARELPESLKELAESGFRQDAMTISQAKARIEETISFLQDFDLDVAFPDDTENNKLTLELSDGMMFENMACEQYVRDWAIPQFYFHIMTAYSILRNAGVDLGKADYVAHMFAYLRPAAKKDA